MEGACAASEYERLRHEVVADAGLLEQHLFGPRPVAEAVLAEVEGAAAGYALFFPTFSTFVEPALAFYRELGARHMGEWQLHRLDDTALARVAGATGDVRGANAPGSA